MSAINVQRQMLPMFPSPNQGARFYNPELPATEPFVPGHRTCAALARYSLVSAAKDNPKASRDLCIMLSLGCHNGIKIGRHGTTLKWRYLVRTLPCIGPSELVGLILYPEPTE